MNTSAHVSLDSKTKIENLMIATEEVMKQLRKEARLASAGHMITAHRYMVFARDQHALVTAKEERTND